MRARQLVAIVVATMAFALAFGAPAWALVAGGSTNTFTDVVGWANILALTVGTYASWDVYRNRRDTNVEQRLRVAISDEVGLERSILLGLDRREGFQSDMGFRQSSYGDPLSRTPRLRIRRGKDTYESTLSEVITYFETYSHSQIIILGNSGTGKTVLAVELLFQLMNAARSGGGPTPVKLSLTTWSPAVREFADWIADELRLRYAVSDRVTKVLLGDRKLVLVLDGLDEMDPTDSDRTVAGTAVRKINEYLAVRHDASVVVTCRSDAYRELPERLVLPGEVTVDPLTKEQIATYINTAHLTREQRDQWEQVATVIRSENGRPVVEQLNTPWRMTLAVTLLRDGQDPSVILLQNGETASQHSERVRRSLLESFVAARARLAVQQRYSSQASEQWASYLASYLDVQQEHGGPRSELLPHIASKQVQGQIYEYRYVSTCLLLLLIAFTVSICATATGWLSYWVGWAEPLHAWRNVLTAIAYPSRALAVAGLAVGVTLLTTPSLGVPRASRTVRRTLRRSFSGPREVMFSGLLYLVSLPATISGVLAAAAASLVATGPLWLAMPGPAVLRVAVGVAAVTSVLFIAPMLWTNYAYLMLTAFQRDYWRRFELGKDEHGTVNLFVNAPPLANTLRPDLAQSGPRADTRNWARAAEDFLNWAYGVGIVKRSGVGFQFRHRELEDWLLSQLDIATDEMPLAWTRDLRAELTNNEGNIQAKSWVYVNHVEGMQQWHAGWPGKMYRTFFRRISGGGFEGHNGAEEGRLQADKVQAAAERVDRAVAASFTPLARLTLTVAWARTRHSGRTELGAVDLIGGLTQALLLPTDRKDPAGNLGRFRTGDRLPSLLTTLDRKNEYSGQPARRLGLEREVRRLLRQELRRARSAGKLVTARSLLQMLSADDKQSSIIRSVIGAGGIALLDDMLNGED
ncbi:NACHT domain-containing protein [Actinoplanes sp. NPDC051411]|uniref:NACHT domain-containing protein n=1 Tax=Actinoplanes sp. NPDC051411 TaxID=3155522 RepID=UPI003413FE9C